MQPEYRKFSVDPQITSFEVLQSLLARAFDIKGEFTISYLSQDEEGKEVYLSLLSDWDLDAAFLNASEPCLQLKVDLKPFEEGLEDWDIITPVDIPRTQTSTTAPERSSFTGTILNHMEKTLNMVQRAFNFGDNDHGETPRPTKPPMTDKEFHNYLDSDGRLALPRELRLSVYEGGIEPCLRKVVWKHILNVYPEGLTAKERISYMKQKSEEYCRLRGAWQDMIASGSVTEEMQFVTNMVRKDVLRTDRTHKFYAGSDDNKNVVSLFNILTTYALNHPSVSYCQGMSDLASPILVTMKDESHAYVCFCAIMSRLKPNFQLDGSSITTKFQHLSDLLHHYDYQFFEYLRQQGADDLLFCYRWLLLELKREFAFDDALRMLEVLWSSLPPSPPEKELALFEEEFTAATASPQSPRLHAKENPYTKVRALRKQNSAGSVNGLVKSPRDAEGNTSEVPCSHYQSLSSNSTITEQSSPGSTNTPRSNVEMDSTVDDSIDYLPMTTSMTRELRMELENLNRHLPGSSRFLQRNLAVDSRELDSPNSQDSCEMAKEGPPRCCQRQMSLDQTTDDDAPETQSWTSDEMSGVDQIHKIGKERRNASDNPLQVNGAMDSHSESLQCYTPDEQCDLDFDDQDRGLQMEITYNGEILENEELEAANGANYGCHLKSVIPIRLVHSPGVEEQRRQRRSSDSSDSSSDNCPVQFGSELGNSVTSIPRTSHNRSEGYGSDGTVSSKESSIQVEVSSNSGRNSGLVDSGVMTNSCEEALDFTTRGKRPTLPPPQMLGGGNPFMLFLCLTLLLQHRDVIMRNNMDYNELAMHFDKMVRKHNVQRVLHQARALFRDYLKMWEEQNWEAANDLYV